MSYQNAVNLLNTWIRDAETDFVSTLTDTRSKNKENTVLGAKGIAQKRNFLLALMQVYETLVDAPWVSSNVQLADLLNQTA